MKIHIIKKGDTLYELAKKHHVELDQIIALNPQIVEPDHLDIGTKVKIPSKPHHVDPPASEYVYKHIVQQGDSLWKLGKAWDVPLQAMIQANPQLKNPNVLMTGEVVYVPKMDHGQVGIKPLTTSKPSTVPFAQVPEAQPWAALESYQQPFMPIMEGPVSETAPSPAEVAPAAQQPIVISHMDSTPIIPAPEPGVIGLHEPFEQAVHPFKQFNISATEVFAFPASDQPAASTYPAYSPYQQAPWEQFPYAAVHPTSYPVSDEGCGCGGEKSMTEQQWSTFPPGYPSGSVGGPWDGYQQGLPPIPGLYSPVFSPYDIQQAAHHQAIPNPYAYQQGPYGIPYAGAHYQAPYESPILPQVHTHELAKETDTEEVIEIDIRPENKADKTTRTSGRSSKSVKLSSAAALNSFLKRQQIAYEKQDPKPNVPWINF